eukprot:PhM_4_TR7769/c0_g1_i1/m.91389
MGVGVPMHASVRAASRHIDHKATLRRRLYVAPERRRRRCRFRPGRDGRCAGRIAHIVVHRGFERRGCDSDPALFSYDFAPRTADVFGECVDGVAKFPHAPREVHGHDLAVDLVVRRRRHTHHDPFVAASVLFEVPTDSSQHNVDSEVRREVLALAVYHRKANSAVAPLHTLQETPTVARVQHVHRGEVVLLAIARTDRVDYRAAGQVVARGHDALSRPALRQPTLREHVPRLPHQQLASTAKHFVAHGTIARISVVLVGGAHDGVAPDVPRRAHEERDARVDVLSNGKGDDSVVRQCWLWSIGVFDKLFLPRRQVRRWDRLWFRAAAMRCRKMGHIMIVRQ